jgi:methylmalonyl-CoA mutase
MIMTSEAKLLRDFPPVTTEQWMEAAKKDLKGADFGKKLLWQTDEGITVRPFYRDEDLAGLQHLGAAPGQFPYVRGTRPENDWEILEEPVEASPDTIAAHRFQDAGATVVQELAYAIAEGIERLATAPERGQTAEDAAGAIAFSFAIGTNFFFEIAKLRAARLLWSLVCESFGCSKCAAKMLIHARTSRWDKTVYDPYVNILRGTTEAMSAAIGGCDTLAISSYDAVHRRPASDGIRLAYNTQLILKHEAWFDRTVDPAGGSYYVELLTDSIAREAWKLVKEIEAAGGFAKAQAAINEAVAKSREKKLAAVASRRRSIVGTNTYANPKEHMLGHVDEAALKANRPRAADQFEDVRFATEASGETPVFLLAELGDLKMRKARSTFMRNFLGCAGFGVQVKRFASVEDAANAAVQGGVAAVVLCSSDTEYSQLAPALIAALKNAGSNAPVIIAGNPQDSVEQLKAAGVADFIHIGSNAAETLRAWQARLGKKE